MKTVIKKDIVKLVAAIFIVSIISSCGSKDGDGLYSDTKTVTYAFKLDDASAEYVTAVIVYGDKLALPSTYEYQGSAAWEVSFSANTGFSPFMYISLVKKNGITPQTFPVTLSYQAGIVNGDKYQDLDKSWTFDDLEEYNEFFVNSPDDPDGDSGDDSSQA